LAGRLITLTATGDPFHTPLYTCIAINTKTTIAIIITARDDIRA
jgi:hypothetical protein